MAHDNLLSNEGRQPGAPDVLFSSQAMYGLRLREISASDVQRALSHDVPSRVDERTGHLVYTLGDVRVVARRDGDSIVVISALRQAEFAGEI